MSNDPTERKNGDGNAFQPVALSQSKIYIYGIQDEECPTTPIPYRFMKLRTCVLPQGCFAYGIHKPAYTVVNLRKSDAIEVLGMDANRIPVESRRNFPADDIAVADADWVYEIPNPFPFRGTTYINRSWADRTAENPCGIRLPEVANVSFGAVLKRTFPQTEKGEDSPIDRMFAELPDALLLSLAANSTDPEDLVRIAHLCCPFSLDPATGNPVGMRYERDAAGRAELRPKSRSIFEVLVNNPHLPDRYKRLMVLKPGTQGESEIVGEWGATGEESHIYEYLRRNSYIAGGHYASNMADDAIRYRIGALSENDIKGLRHLYYQRSFVRLAEQLSVPFVKKRETLSEKELESLRVSLLEALKGCRDTSGIEYTGTIWGWNFGFDYAPSGYRLHASHQQIHQQYAMVPERIASYRSDGSSSAAGMVSYGCGDLIAEFLEVYYRETGHHFFEDYLAAIRTNQRTDRKRGKAI